MVYCLLTTNLLWRICLAMLFFGLPLVAKSAGPLHLPGQYVWSGEQKIHIDCRGTGSPTVVLEAGLGGFSLEWQPVQGVLSRTARVCTYDRPGYGYSGNPVVMPRTAAQIAHELRNLLRMAGEAPPYLLAGHSFGGLVVQYFASFYPQETAGLALIDSASPDQFQKLESQVTHTRLAPANGRQFVLFNAQQVPASLAEPQRSEALALMNSRAPIALYSELSNFRASAAGLQKLAEHIPNLPALVISRARPNSEKAGRSRRLEFAWDSLQEGLARRLLAERRVSVEGDHHLHLTDPEIVVKGLNDMLASIRRPAFEPDPSN